MFEKILVVCRGNIFTDYKKYLDEIKRTLYGKKIKIIRANELKNEYVRESELIITLGGDGTFLKAASYALNQFIIGINSNPKTSEGALTSFNIENLAFIKNILAGKFKVLLRPRAKVIRNGIVLDKLALNEVYVGSRSQFHTSRYKINFNNKSEEHRSSGVLISTGTGSKAWYASAGGKPFEYSEERLKFLIREPFFGKLFKPKILKGEISKEEKIKIESTGKLGAIVLDSNNAYRFEGGDVAEIMLSQEPLKVLVPLP